MIEENTLEIDERGNYVPRGHQTAHPHTNTNSLRGEIELVAHGHSHAHSNAHHEDLNRALSQNSSSRRLSTTTAGSFMEREIGCALPAGGGSFMNYYASNEYNFDKDEALHAAFLQIFRAHNKQKQAAIAAGG